MKAIWLFCSLLLVLGAISGLEEARAANPNWPNGPEQNPRDEPPDDPGFNGAWNLISYIPDAALETVREAELPLGSGIQADRAWQVTIGSPAVVIAVTDSGVFWNNHDLNNKLYLNRGELPLPEGSSVYDANGDGAFDIRDYAADSRVYDNNGNGQVDPGDLIQLFSDGADDDANGYPDDISGWDFFRHDNDPFDDTGFHHGTSEALLAAAEGNNGSAGIGVCPRCQILPIRVSDSYVADINHFAQGVIFAVDSGASVILDALGTITNSPFAAAALDYAYDHGVSVAASAADENSFHHNYPACYNRTVQIDNLIYEPDAMEEVYTFMALDACTNWGPKTTVSGASHSCSSGSTGLLGGALGLIYSRAVEINLDPPLSTDEVFGIVAMSATDVYLPEGATDPFVYRTLEGWDKYTGHGRLNCRRAVDLVAPTTIPPEVHVDSPGWFELVDPNRADIPVEGYVHARRATSYSYRLEAQAGLEPLPDNWIVFAEATDLTEPTDGLLGLIDPARLDLTKAVSIEASDHHAVLVRLTVTDSLGNQVLYYYTFFLYRDDDWAAGFPKYLGASGEASPLMADLNNDQVFELVVAANDGLVHAYNAQGRDMPGWPVRVGRIPGQNPEAFNYLGSPAYLSGAVDGDVRQGFLSGVAVGDLDADGEMDVVVGTVDGEVYAWRSDGSLRDGFPVAMNPVFQQPLTDKIDYGFMSYPVLVDLDPDADETLEIVIAGMDMYVYAWRHDGSELEGWPVLCRDGDRSGRINATPALADLDGNGRFELVVGTSEIIDDAGRVYALQPEGNSHPDGPFLPGWPVAIPGIELDYLPFFGNGVPSSAAAFDFDGDGDDEIVINAGIYWPLIYDGDGAQLAMMSPWVFSFLDGTIDPIAAVLNANYAIADLDGSGRPAVLTSGLGLRMGLQMLFPGKRINADSLLLAWYADDGRQLRAFPQVYEDVLFIGAMAVADITGDGKPEVIGGSGGHYLHAYDADGNEPEGWPKFNGGWILQTPAVGDMDGDGYFEVAVQTREGYLFVYDTMGPADGNLQWASHQHDQYNTGNYRFPLPVQPGPILDDDDDDNDDNDDNDDDNDNDDDDNNDNDNDLGVNDDDAGPDAPAPTKNDDRNDDSCGC